LGYGTTWEPECWAQLVELYGGNEEDADAAGSIVEWRLQRDPFVRTRRLVPRSNVYVTWIDPWKDYPAVAFSFRIEKEQFRQNCVLEKARKANVPDRLS
jgi:hypothetical protein